MWFFFLISLSLSLSLSSLITHKLGEQYFLKKI